MKSSIAKQIKDICESPKLNDEELPYKKLDDMSSNQLRRAYDHIATTSDKVNVYMRKPNPGFVAGRFDYKTDSLAVLVKISGRVPAYPVTPTGLTNLVQVSMVNVSKYNEDLGYTKRAYQAIVKSGVDLVSDAEQYLGAEGLWKAVARFKDINVYVFSKDDYLRDDEGKIIRYDSKNISQSKIWGGMDKMSTLLVATSKSLK